MNQVAKKVLREKVAIHEAAHAVAFVHFGLSEYMGDLRLDVPEIMPCETEFPKEGMVLGHLELEKQPMFPDGTTDPVELQTIEGLCLSHLVAKPGEMKYLRDTFRTASEDQFALYRWPGGDSDVTGAIRLAFPPHADRTLGVVRDYLYRIWDDAKAFVDTPEHWFIIQALAVELLDRKHIPKEDVLLLIRAARDMVRLGRAGAGQTSTLPVSRTTAAPTPQRREIDQLPANRLTHDDVLTAFRESLLPDLYA